MQSLVFILTAVSKYFSLDALHSYRVGCKEQLIRVDLLLLYRRVKSFIPLTITKFYFQNSHPSALARLVMGLKLVNKLHFGKVSPVCGLTWNWAISIIGKLNKYFCLIYHLFEESLGVNDNQPMEFCAVHYLGNKSVQFSLFN